jgi:hypothetical protein
MRSIIHTLDRLVRRSSGVFEFCNDPDCVFRVSIGVAAYPLRVPDGEILPGAKVLHLHFWNEHLPPVPDDGPRIGTAVKLRRMVAHSAKLLADSMMNDPRLAGVKAVGGVTPLFSPGDNSAAEWIFLRLGFSVTPYRNPWGRFMEFWEERYAWLIIWAFTDRNKSQRRSSGLRRSEFWISADEFLRRYGSPAEKVGALSIRQGRASHWWRQT